MVSPFRMCQAVGHNKGLLSVKQNRGRNDPSPGLFAVGARENHFWFSGSAMPLGHEAKVALRVGNAAGHVLIGEGFLHFAGYPHHQAFGGDDGARSHHGPGAHDGARADHWRGPEPRRSCR